MTKYYRKVFTGDLKGIYKHAIATCNPCISNAVDDSLQCTVRAARAAAPVYNPGLWLEWWGYENHYILPGTLRTTIQSTHVNSFGNGRTFTARFIAGANWASHMEKGFKHKKAKRKIRGKKFMQSSVRLVFGPTVKIKLDRAARKMFRVL